MSRACVSVLVAALLAPAAVAYVAPAHHEALSNRGPQAGGAALAASALDSGRLERAEPASATEGSGAFGLLSAGCALGAAIGFLRARGQRAAAGVVSAAGLLPLAAWAAERQAALESSSVTVAASEEALFYIFVIFLTLTVLILAIFLREAPGLD
eukprot:CAMPEP_0117622974 /NCGR_PEP_ID=MMETSP0784-20121206/88413_1 /TAXON_ID=39447 /ORGANISM="" /LENGTH=154 /DNA_ID=CAMNT_0005426921 /DNA_START=48 /DNA_END=512 /DNA_ORIENTATION=-